LQRYMQCLEESIDIVMQWFIPRRANDFLDVIYENGSLSVTLK